MSCLFYKFQRTDHEAPVIIDMPDSITQPTDSGWPTATVFWTEPTVSDNSGVQTLSSTHLSGFHFNIGVTTVVYTSVDSSSNQMVKSFTVAIEGKDTLIFLRGHNWLHIAHKT